MDDCTLPTLIKNIDVSSVNQSDYNYLLDILDESSYWEARAQGGAWAVVPGFAGEGDFDSFASQRETRFQQHGYISDKRRAAEHLQIKYATDGMIQAWLECKRLEASKYGLYIAPFVATRESVQFVIKWSPTSDGQNDQVSNSQVVGGIVDNVPKGQVFNNGTRIGTTGSFIVTRRIVQDGETVPAVSGFVEIDGQVNQPFLAPSYKTQPPPPPPATYGGYYNIDADTGAGYRYLMVDPSGGGYGTLVAARPEQNPEWDRAFVIENVFKAPVPDTMYGSEDVWIRATRGDPYLSGVEGRSITLVDAREEPALHKFSFVPLGGDNTVRLYTGFLIRAGDDRYLSVAEAGVNLGPKVQATRFRLKAA